VVGQAGKRRAGDSATYQGVFQHTQINARFTRLAPQHCEVTDLDATIFGDRDSLGVGYLCRHLGYDSFFCRSD